MLMKITVFASLFLSILLSRPALLYAQEADEPATNLTCGPELTCDASSQYCSVVVGGPGGMAVGHTCVDVPGTAEPLTCESIQVPVGSECTDTEDGVVVTTQAP